MELNTKVNATRPDVPYVMVQTLLVVPFRVKDTKKLQARMLPKPLEPVGDGDVAYMCMVETTMPALREPLEGEPPEPDMAEFHELAIGMDAQYNNEVFGYMSQVCLDRQTAGLRRGILRNITYTQLSDVQPLLTGRSEMCEGLKMMGISYRPHGEMVAKATMELKRKETWDEVPIGMKRFAHSRYLKDPANNNEPFIMDVPLFEFVDGLTGCGVVWRGPTTLEFGGDYYDKWKDIGEFEPLEGYLYCMGYCYGKDSLITTLEEKGDWKWF